MNNMVMVASASDSTLIVNVPDLPLHRVWKKRGASYPIDRRILLQAYYTPSVENLFKEGLLITNDVDFLREVGLIEEDGTHVVEELTASLLNRLIKTMPLSEVKTTLKKLSHSQAEELANYAIEHYNDLQMDRVDIIGKAAGKDLMRAIEHHRRTLED